MGIARCIYKEADLILMDDPLSALDIDVGNEIFHSALRKYLKGKTRIIVTHSIQYLKHFDLIIFMDKGRILK